MDDSRLLDTFLDLVRIDSPSKREGQVANYCKAILEDAGCHVCIDDSAGLSGSDTGNVIATLPGTAPGKVFIVAHMDNVNPCRGVHPVIESGVVYSDGTTVLGADDKAGVAVAIEAIRTMAESEDPYPTMVALFTVQEEIGMHGSKNLPDDLFAGELTLVCDAECPPGSVVIAAPYHYSFTALFQGRASHAGVAPEAGISAIRMASAAIDSMELGRIAPNVSANIGTISGGNADNIIPAECRVTGECRALTRETLDRTRTGMEAAMQAAAKASGGSVVTDWKLEYEGFRFDEEDEMVKLVCSAATRIGLEARVEISGGGTDANILSSKGARPLALGTGMADFHATTEHIAIRDLIDTTRHVLAICSAVAAR